MATVVIRHSLSYGSTPATKKHYAECSCGWRAPARAKLTHVISDLRDHSAEVQKAAKEKGWQMRRGEGLSVDVWEVLADTPESLPVNVRATG